MPETLVEREDGQDWVVLRLKSSAGLNKLGSATLQALRISLSEALEGGGLRCLGISGQGGSFAVGADLREIRSLTPSSAREFSDLGNGIFRLLERASALVVAGIDGFCLGGGLDLALAADWRLATDRSLFGHPGADLGLITGFGGTQRLPRLVGARRALSWFLTAQRIGAEQAYGAGLVQEVCPSGDFDARLMERVKRFAALPPGTAGELKRRLAHSDPLSGGNPWPIP